MVFQKPNPFPKSIYENIAWGARINGFAATWTSSSSESLRQAALWDEVKDKLHQSGLALSGGQQQRLCIARAIAVEAGGHSDGRAVRRRSTRSPRYKIEDLMDELTKRVHDHHRHAQHAAGGARLDYTAFFSWTPTVPVRWSSTARRRELFTKPNDKRTEDYITGRFG